MNVLHLGLEKSWRGGENQIYLLIEGLKKLGVNNFVAYPEESRGYERFKVLCPTLGLPSSSGYDLRSIRLLAQWIGENRISIVDAHSSGAHALGLALKILIPHLKLVVHRRVDNPISDRFLTRKKYQSHSVDHFIAISDCIKRMLVAYGVEENRISVVKSSIDIDKYQYLDRGECRKELIRELKIKDPKFLMGNASAFTDQKGYDVLIQSLKPLKDKGLNFHCVLAGDGPLLNEMKVLAKNLSLSSHVTFLGFTNKVPQLLSSIDLLVMPSNNEGLGTLILDAVAAGCGVVATRVGGIPEMIINGETGYTVPKGDHQALAKAIENVIVNRKQFDEMSKNAKEYIRCNFSLEAMVNGNLSVYKSV
ncbi:MAG: glycosyltransferase family 4 protein [Bdellovibrionales bacterium]